MDGYVFDHMIACILNAEKYYISCMACAWFDECLKVKPILRIAYSKVVPTEEPISWEKKEDAK